MKRSNALVCVMLMIMLAHAGTANAERTGQEGVPGSTIPPQAINGPRIEATGKNQFKATFGGPVPALSMQQAAGNSAFTSLENGLASPLQVELPATRGQTAFRMSVNGYVYPWPETSQKSEAMITGQAELHTPPCTSSVSTDACPPISTGLLPAQSPIQKTAPVPLSEETSPVVISGEIAWQPLGLFVVAGDNTEIALATANSASATQVNSVVEYDLGLGVREVYLATSFGLERSLRFETREAFKDMSIGVGQHLESRTAITLPAGYALFADGQVQASDFATSGAIEMRDAQNNVVLNFTPVMLADAANTPNAAQGSYRVTRAGGAIMLAERVPLDWLAAQERILPAAVNVYLGLTPPLMDTFVHAGLSSSNFGSATDMWISESGSAFVKWNLSGLPQKAMIDAAYARLGYFNASGVPTVTVSAHRITNDWSESQATYSQRFTGVAWNTAGGDYDATSEVSATLYGTPPFTVQYPSWYLQSLVANWKSGFYSNYGILFRGTPSIPGNFNKIVYSKESIDGNRFSPQLDLYYTLGPITLTQNSQYARNVPSPDWYAFDSGSSPANNMWQGFGLQPGNNSDYDMFLLANNNAGLNNTIAASTYGGSFFDYILIDRNHAPTGFYYPTVIQYNGRDNYSVEYTRRSSNTAIVAPNSQTANIPSSMDSMEVYDLDLTAGRNYSISVRPTAGNPDIGIALHASNPATASTWYQGRGQALIQRDTLGNGKQEGFGYSTPTSDRYGLIVMTKNASGPMSYNIYVDDTPPAGAFSINNGAQYTNNPNVTLNNAVSDTGTGMNDMRYRNLQPLKVLIFRDIFPWGYNAIPDVLGLADVQPDVFGTNVMTSTDLSQYSVIIIPSVQGDAFCNIYNNNAERFASFVQAGGTLVMQSAGYTTDTCSKTLPGGASSIAAYDINNTIDLPSHPIALGVSTVLTGFSASHGFLTNLPAGSTIIARRATPSAEPTLAEYTYGAGRVIASTLTDEFYWPWSSNDIGKVLTNKLTYAVNQSAYAANRTWTLPAGDGAKTVHGEFRNNAGMWTPLQSDSIVLDTQPPQSQVFLPASLFNGPVNVSWTANDATSPVSSAALWVKYNNGAWAPTGLPAQAGASGTFNYTPAFGDGNYAFAAVATDVAGNVEAAPVSAGNNVVIDRFAPESQATSPARVYKDDINVNWSAGDATSGISGVALWVKFNNGAWVPTGLPAQIGTSGTFRFTPTQGEGSYSFATVATDPAGNVESSPSGIGDSVSRFGPARIFTSIVTRSFNRYCPSPCEEESNNTSASANGPLIINTTLNGIANDNSDYFYFDLADPSTVRIDLENHVGANLPGQLLQLQLRPGNNPAFIYPDYVYKAPYTYIKSLSAGRYFIRIAYTGPLNFVQPYRLRLSLK
jgi:hypothetical protein